MIKVEQYKLFYNSKDFEKIYNKSIPELLKYLDTPHEVFFKEVVKPSIDNNICIILYNESEPIGYEIVKIVNKTINGGFTFILPEHRGKKYSYLLREKMFDILKDKINSFTTYIHNSNINSIESAKKTAQKLNLDLEISDTIVLSDGTNKNAKKYTIITK